MTRSKKVRHAGVLLPVAVLSSAWTLTMALPSSGVTPKADAPLGEADVAVPGELPVAPASVTTQFPVLTAGKRRAATSVVAASSTNGIPAAALAAYQRAAQVIDSADPACKVDWPLLAAVGRVESDHGRYGGSVLDDTGVAHPAIYGLPLDGSRGTARITDTDAGELDGDPKLDRAVGPLQFLPATWHAVGVDGDGDGERNPQDIDDAALAAAVYLCSGKGDLSTEDGATSALLRYNHSREYADLVRSTADTYRSGAYSTMPTMTLASVSFAPAAGDGDRHPRPQHHAHPANSEDVSVYASSVPKSSWAPGHTTKPAPAAPAPRKDAVSNLADGLVEATEETLDGTVGSLLDKLGLGGLLKQS